MSSTYRRLTITLLLAAGCVGTNVDSSSDGRRARIDDARVAHAERASRLSEAESRLRSDDLVAARALVTRLEADARIREDDAWSGAVAILSGRLATRDGEQLRARAEFGRALAHSMRAQRPDLEATALLYLGIVESTHGANDAALEAFERSRMLASESHHHLLAARAATNLLRARVRRDTRERGNDSDEADPGPPLAHVLETVERSIRRVPAGPERAGLDLHAARSLLASIEPGRAETVRHERSQRSVTSDLRARFESAAESFLTRGLAIVGEAADGALAAELHGELGRLARLRDRPDEAIRRTQFALLESERVGSEANRIRWHRQMGLLLVESGDAAGAAGHYARAVELLQRHRHALARTGGGERREQDVRREIRSVYLGYVALLLERAEQARADAQRQADLMLARDTLERFKAAELRNYFEDECVDRAKRRVETVDRLASGTTVLYPVVLADRLALLASSREGIELRRVAVTARELEETVRALRARLVRRTTNQYRRPARRLYRWLIEPIEDLLAQHETDTIVFVPDGILRTIPLAALYDGEHFLVERFAIATTPGIELTDPRPLPREALDALLGGLSVANQGFDALPQVETELYDVRERLGGELLLNQGFREEAVTRRLREKDFDIVHFATHASFDRDASTGFLLTYDGRLALDAFADSVAGGRYREKPLELLVLSACETARGDERAALGLSGIAIKAGARSAIGSLWLVNDEAASRLLVGFYDALRAPETTRAEALREAQRALLADRRFRHPAFWSPFLLLNSWL